MIQNNYLRVGGHVRVVTFSRFISGIRYRDVPKVELEFAKSRIESLGLQVSFGSRAFECDGDTESSLRNRLLDFHEAFEDPCVHCILAAAGGRNAMQMVGRIDYDIVAKNAKPICGYSDVGHILNAIYAKTKAPCFYGPNFSSFTMREGFEYSLQHFEAALTGVRPLQIVPAPQWSDDRWTTGQETRVFLKNEGWWNIRPGTGAGHAVGGSYYCLNMLQGTPFLPTLPGAIIFLEAPAEGSHSLPNLDNAICSLALQPGFRDARAIVIGRFARSAGITCDGIKRLFDGIASVPDIPIIANVDFGHTTPAFTIPLGERCEVTALSDTMRLKFDGKY